MIQRRTEEGYSKHEGHPINGDKLLQVKGLSKSYTDFQLQEIGFGLPFGCIMGFLGKNGAGKSTTLKAIMDLIAADQGDIRILGLSMSEQEVEIKEQVGYVSDTPLLNDKWTVGRTLKFVRHFYRHWDQQMVESNLERFAIPLNKKVEQLSKGMKVKFSLILAMAHRPKLLLLDEPTTGLDPVARGEVLDLLLTFVEDGSRSVLFSSHITSDVEKIADVVTLINDGRLLLSEDKESLLERYRRIIISGNEQNVIHHPLLFNVQETRSGYIAYTSQYDELYAQEGQRIASGKWRAERLTLEELFVLLTGKRGA